MNHLLILAPNWLGDAVMALPAIADLHRASPATGITVAARPAIAPLFTLVPHVRDVVVLDPADLAVRPRFSGARAGPGGAWTDFDTALLLPNSFRAALLVLRGRIPERWGYRTECRGPLLTRAIERAPAGLHQVEYYQQLVHALGFPNGPVEPALEAPPAVRTAGADALARAGWKRQTPVVALAPGAAYGGAKRWPPECFADVARALAADGVTTVMVGSGADAATGQEIDACAGAVRILNLIGSTDLRTLAGVLATCRAMVSNDSGAMHLAAALGVRVTAVFGPTDEMATGPRGDTHAHAVITHPVWCRPCLLRECPLDHACMRGVRVDAVLTEARRTL
jgi:heptosyltransferase-2